MTSDPSRPPRLFIASSSAQLPLIESIREVLEPSVTVELWHQGVFQCMESFLTSLILEMDHADFGLFIFAADDFVFKKGKESEKPKRTVRDNVVFELGLFLGRLGRERCFVLKPKDEEMHILSDLLGVTLAEYPSTHPCRLDEPGWECLSRIRDKILSVWSASSGRFCEMIEGTWLEVKEASAARRYSLIEMEGRTPETLRIRGASYDAQGKLGVSWPTTEVDFTLVASPNVLHAFQAEMKSGKGGVAHGISVFEFFEASKYLRGRGYYTTYSEAKAIRSNRVVFWMRKITPEFRDRLCGPRGAEADGDASFIRAAEKIYGPRRVVITGPTHAGKTTLIAALKKRGFGVLGESAERVIAIERARFPKSPKGDAPWRKWRKANNGKLQKMIFERQLKDERTHRCEGGILFMDRSGIDCICYRRLGGEAPREMVDYAWDSRFAAVFVLDVIEPFAPRSETGRTTATKEEAEEMGERLFEVYNSFGYEPVRVPPDCRPDQRSPSEGVEALIAARVNFVLQRLRVLDR